MKAFSSALFTKSWYYVTLNSFSFSYYCHHCHHQTTPAAQVFALFFLFMWLYNSSSNSCNNNNITSWHNRSSCYFYSVYNVIASYICSIHLHHFHLFSLKVSTTTRKNSTITFNSRRNNNSERNPTGNTPSIQCIILVTC